MQRFPVLAELLDTALYLTFGSLALLGAGLDVRMMVSGGAVSGRPRLTRQVFPDDLRGSGVLVVPSLLVVASLCYWLLRLPLGVLRRKKTIPTVPETS